MLTDKAFPQAPFRDESLVGARAYSHDGEFSPQDRDFALPGRGLSFQLIRTYRSANAHEIGPLEAV